MPKPNIIILIILLTLISFVPSVRAALVDAETHWLIVDATPDARAHASLNALTELLVNRGKVPSEQIHRLEGERAISAEIQTHLTELQRQGTLIFLYHGAVTKPRGMNAMHLITQDETSIEDRGINQWFKASGADQAVVIIDGYTEDANLSAYYANRETLGDAALNVIQSVNVPDTGALLQKIRDALAADATDTNDNRRLSIIEVYELLRTSPTFEAGILAPTGDVEAALLKLSPAIKITTFPERAQIFFNDEEVGTTPKLITENLVVGTSTFVVKKAGYLIPPAKTAELQLVLGEAAQVGWALEPISVFGTVTEPRGESVAGARVMINGTGYEQVVGEDGTYRFEEWTGPNVLVLGETYTLSVKLGELHYGTATFLFDGYASIEQPLVLEKKTWFEMTQIVFDQGNPQGAIDAFQNGIALTTDIPQFSSDLTVLLFSSFADMLEKVDVQDVTYLVVTAKLAEQHGQPELAKQYWEQVKAKAQKGTSAAIEANERLWELNRTSYYINIGLIVLLVLLVASGTWTFLRYRKSRA